MLVANSTILKALAQEMYACALFPSTTLVSRLTDDGKKVLVAVLGHLLINLSLQLRSHFDINFNIVMHFFKNNKYFLKIAMTSFLLSE